MKKLGLIFIISLLVNACSFSSSNKEVATSKPSDELEFAADAFSEALPSEIKVEEQAVSEIKIPDDAPPVVEKALETVEVKPEEMKISGVPEKTGPVIPQVGNEEYYQVQKGDTLMMIAFKIYGDYRKWKDLKEWNKEKLKTKMGPGDRIKYLRPEQSFGWQPNGLPYLLKTGDTLGLVSLDKYGTPKKWKSIYENNRPLIRNPNIIFAGFTIYYVPTRDIASKRR